MFLLRSIMPVIGSAEKVVGRNVEISGKLKYIFDRGQIFSFQPYMNGIS